MASQWCSPARADCSLQSKNPHSGQQESRGHSATSKETLEHSATTVPCEAYGRGRKAKSLVGTFLCQRNVCGSAAECHHSPSVSPAKGTRTAISYCLMGPLTWAMHVVMQSINVMLVVS